MSGVSLNKLYADEPEFGDYFALLKPRVMSLVVFTTFVGYLCGYCSSNLNINPWLSLVFYNAFNSKHFAGLGIFGTLSHRLITR